MASNVRVFIEGDDTAAAHLEVIAKETSLFSRELVEDLAHYGKSRMRHYAPEGKTGHLIESIDTFPEGGPELVPSPVPSIGGNVYRMSVIAGADYANIVDTGRRKVMAHGHGN